MNNNSKEKGVVLLNEDVCTEILLRLPVKSVTKFQLVCKRWFSIISTDQFRRLHTLGCPKPPPPSLILDPRGSRFLYLNPFIKNPKPLPFSIKLAHNPKYVTIVSSCNGLLLLRCRGDDTNDDLFVYNPTTKQSRKLCLSGIFMFDQFHLEFDPTISIHYKIICVGMWKTINHSNVGWIAVFDSKSTGIWNVNEVPIHGCLFDFGSPALLYRNMIYTKDHDHEWNGVFSFELDDRVCRMQFRIPPILPNLNTYINSDSDRHLMHVSNGCLYYVSLLSGGNKGEGETVSIWTLQGEYFSLVYSHRLSRSLLRGRPSRPFRFIAETSTLLIDVRRRIVAYCFLDKSYNHFLDLKKGSYRDYDLMHLNYSKCVHHFCATLAPL